MKGVWIENMSGMSGMSGQEILTPDSANPHNKRVAEVCPGCPVSFQLPTYARMRVCIL
jgi:hypothetical protein